MGCCVLVVLMLVLRHRQTQCTGEVSCSCCWFWSWFFGDGNHTHKQWHTSGSWEGAQRCLDLMRSPEPSACCCWGCTVTTKTRWLHGCSKVFGLLLCTEAVMHHYSSVFTESRWNQSKPGERHLLFFSLVFKKRTQYNVFMLGRKGSELQSLA